MSRENWSYKRWGAGLFLALFSCHDAPRNNPFDPALTPPVELQVALDDTAGTVTLTWTRYAGKQPFEEYRVLRKQPGLEKVDTLAHLTEIAQTTYVDASLALDTDYGYRVEVVNAGGYAAASQEQGARPLNLPAVELEEPVFESATASASLRWTPYAGPRFKAYQVVRRTAELAAQVIEEIADIADTSLVNSGLEGNTEYFYRVVVVTEREEKVESEERSGIFHKLLDTWPLEWPGRPFVRLYREGDGIAALISGGTLSFNPQLFVFDSQGQVQTEEIEELRTLAFPSHSLAMTLDPAGRRFLGIGYLSILLPLSPDGQLVQQERELFADFLPEPLSGAEGKVLGEISLLNRVRGGGSSFDNIAVSTNGRELFAEDFSRFADNTAAAEQVAAQGWEFPRGLLSLAVRDGVLIANTTPVIRRTDESWQDFRLEADVVVGSRAGIQVGGDTFSRFALWLDRDEQRAILEWTFSPPEELGLEPKARSDSLSLQVTSSLRDDQVVSGLPYRLSLEVVKGKVSASVKGPVVLKVAQGSERAWASLASLGNTLALTVDNQPYSVSQEGEAVPLPPFDVAVSEVRVWKGKRGTQMGACLPGLNRLELGLVLSGAEPEWPTALSKELGPALGGDQGFMFNPISFDVGPDGRIYVLDAGNARIVVFDEGRRYITQWGHKGDEPGEFNFGAGARGTGNSLDFAGSVAVDSQGFIYVADELNKRIQKFAP